MDVIRLINSYFNEICVCTDIWIKIYEIMNNVVLQQWSMRKEVIAPILVLLMLVGMGSYAMMNNDSTGDESPDEGIDDNQFNDEWDVYYVDSGSDLPACGSATLGR